MPKLNPYFIPKENLAKTEQVIYLDHNYQPMSYEEFMKTYQTDEEVEFLTEAEYQDRVLHGPQYGPGFLDDLNKGEVGEAFKKVGHGVVEVGKFGGKVVVGAAVGAAVIATGPISIPIGATTAAAGYCFKKAAEQDDCPVVGYFADAVMGGAIGGTASAIVGTASSSLVSKGANLALNSALSNGSEELLRVWIYTKAAQMGYELGSKSKQVLEGFASFYHGTHRGNGIEYESECPICNGNFDKYFWL